MKTDWVKAIGVLMILIVIEEHFKFNIVEATLFTTGMCFAIDTRRKP